MADSSHTARLLVLYGTLGCHLCELAERLLLPYVSEGWQIELVDIAEEDALLERFSSMIPVLACVESERILSWPFDADTLKNFLVAEFNVSAREV